MSVSHWTHSRPILEMVEAAFAKAIFIGPQLPSDSHTLRSWCGCPGRLVALTTLDECHAPNCIGVT
jgi:hypothetical protein